MRILNLLRNHRGATLIEAMVAICVLTVGIITVMVMQARAIEASSMAINRTEGNLIALSLLESFKELPFTNANLACTGATPGSLANDANARTFTAGTLPEMQSLIQVPVAAAAGTIVDRAGITYQLSWAVQDRILASGQILNKTIRVFMTWNTPMGQNRLEMTTVKYNNVSL